MNILRQCNICKLQKSGHSFILTLNQTSRKDEHLLNPTRIDSIREYLVDVKSKATKGSVLITTAEGESFCRGFDYRHAREQAGGSDEAYKKHLQDMIDRFKEVVKDLISLPMPTIAAINGYATEAGLMLGLSHDYLTITPDILSLRAGLLSREMSLPGYFSALIRSKVGSPLARRSLVLRDLQFDAKEAAKMGVLDLVHEVGRDTVKVAESLAEKLATKEWNSEVYAEIRKALYPELCKELGLTSTTMVPALGV
ncbi:hypothetical protein ACH5RR_003112 [Cinchona calisaya]|uniref:Uncharacterized protein n=1 Tax=Cinchona calisaya TaxID=153742 RepID=A0ABD3AU86_9GENT